MTRIKPSESSSRKRFQTEFLFDQLVNLPDDGVSRFRKQYSSPPTAYDRYSDDELLTMRDELRAFWKFQAERSVRFTKRTERIQATRDAVPEWPLQKIICDHWLTRERLSFEVIWKKQKKLIRACPQCLPAVLAWACVFHSPHMKFCRNPSCSTPYYLAKRKDQKYCSDTCAIPAKREAKRKWWRKHGRQQSSVKN